MKTLNARLNRERMESTKRRTSLAWLIAALLAGVLSLSFAGAATSWPPAQGEAALAQLKERGLYDSLQEALATARYGVYPEPHQPASWQAENPAQQINARFTAEGVQVQTKPDHGHPPRIGMKLRSVGYGERPIGVSAARLTTSGSRIEYRRLLVGKDSAAGAITEWYVNTAAGLEQGFTLESAPGERRDGERLRVVLALEGDLRAQAVDGGQALEFTDGAGRRVLRYDHLVVRDGAGRELEARMAVRMEGGEAEAWLEVDDRDAVWPVTIDPAFSQQQKLEASDVAPVEVFGTSVAISGETVVVGAPRGGSMFEGSAYVFVRSGGGWSQQQKLEASDRALIDLFGTSVAISGETVVVGATRGGSMDQGLAYVFVRSGGGWSQQQKLEASDGAPIDLFGTSVAISGETVVVGAPYGGSMDQGLAYVFVRSGGGWSQQQKLEASDAPALNFGTSVAISGETVVVGAPGAGSNFEGSAYVFVRSGVGWSQQQKLEASDAVVFGALGTSVAISGETVVAGAQGGGSNNQGSAYVFVRSSGGGWSQQQKLEASDAPAFNDQFGASVAISGETIVVGRLRGGTGPVNDGSAYVFVRSGVRWSQPQKLQASDASEFGASVAISGETVVVGAPSSSMFKGSAYVFGKAFYLHGAGPDNNPPVLFLNDSAPIAATAKFRDSASLKFAGGNPWKEIGTWPAVSKLTTGNLTALSDLRVWLGLKNSDDQGTRFDLRVEVYKNNGLVAVAVGHAFCIQGVTRNPNLAKEVTLKFDPFSPVPFNGTTDVLSLRVLARIGTNPTGGFCGGHSNAVGLRLYFDAISRAAQFGATFE